MGIRLINGDCLEVIRRLGLEKVSAKCIFADPPDNLGWKYVLSEPGSGELSTYNDSRSPDDYYNWIRLIIMESLPRCQIFWLSYNQIHDLEIKYIVRDILKYRHPAFEAMMFLWRYGFSEYRDNDCACGFRPIIRLKRRGVNVHVDHMREPSERMKLNDPRAAGPRVPDNVWSFPRVMGNFDERREFHPNQHSEKLMERIIRMSCGPEELFIDLFLGSGTSLVVGKRIGFNVTGIELSSYYCNKIASILDVPCLKNL
jgi:DNA modification methylase